MSGTDQLAAHLDRAWDLIEQKRFGQVTLAAREVLKIDPENAEGFTLLGMAALGERELEEALEAFDRARDLDPEFLAPLLCGAEALALDPERMTEAAERLESAYELTEPGSAEHLDVLLMHVVTLIDCKDLGSAKRRLSKLRPAWLELDDQRLQAGKLALELDEDDLAARCLEPLANAEEPSCEALYGLAQLAERRGDPHEAVALSLRIHQWDLRRAAGRDLMPPSELLELARHALEGIGSAQREVIAGVALRIVDAPAEELVADGIDPWIPLLLTGPPAEGDAGARAGHLFLYRCNLQLRGLGEAEALAQLRGLITEAAERYQER